MVRRQKKLYSARNRGEQSAATMLCRFFGFGCQFLQKVNSYSESSNKNHSRQMPSQQIRIELPYCNAIPPIVLQPLTFLGLRRDNVNPQTRFINSTALFQLSGATSARMGVFCGCSWSTNQPIESGQLNTAPSSHVRRRRNTIYCALFICIL